MADDDRRGLDRRDFLRAGLAAGAGTALLGAGGGRRPPSSPGGSGSGGRPDGPVVVTSHTNDTGREALERAWEGLAAGGSALDAVETGANHVEVDPDDHSVGVGGLPNAEGVVQLDASIMDGARYDAGSVAALEGIATPSSVARLVMERTDHVMLVGEGARDFARSFGFEETELLTDEARRIWLRWRERRDEGDDWGPADHLRGTDRATPLEGALEGTRGTVNVLAVDGAGDAAGITTTSGLAWKVPGRVGDSPIVGAGLYVDNAAGAAGVTGRGEDVIKSCAANYVVMRMAAGRSPQQACEDAADRIVAKYETVGIDFLPPEKFVALGRDGRVGCCTMGTDRPARMTVLDADGIRVQEGTLRHAG